VDDDRIATPLDVEAVVEVCAALRNYGGDDGDWWARGRVWT
jgi:hypothetical protein